MPHASDIKLTNDEEAAIMAGERQLLELLPIVDKLESCGADCDERRRRIESLMGIAANLRQHFGTIPVEAE